MNDLALLIEAIAALITATGGATAAVIVAVRSSSRQRTAAAEEAARLAGSAHDGDPHGNTNGGPRHRLGTSRRSVRDTESDGLVERLQSALELSREAERDIRDELRRARDEHEDHDHEHHDDGGSDHGE